MAQDAIRAPEVTTGPGYGLSYTLYLHFAAWVLRKSVLVISGTGTSFDKVIRVETPGLGEGHVNVAVCLPRAGLVEPKPLLLVVEGGGFVLGQPTDGEHIIRPLSD
jgi:acetyl esterase